MGQSLKKTTTGTEGKKVSEIESIIENECDNFLKDGPKTFSEFYRGVCKIVEKINIKLGNTQFIIPETNVLQREFDEYQKKEKGKQLKEDGKQLTKEEFREILAKVITTNTDFTGFGAKEILLYIFGVPVISTLAKDRAMPKAIPNEYFIPGITSVTVLILAVLNKI